MWPAFEAHEVFPPDDIHHGAADVEHFVPNRAAELPHLDLIAVCAREVLENSKSCDRIDRGAVRSASRDSLCHGTRVDDALGQGNELGIRSIHDG